MTTLEHAAALDAEASGLIEEARATATRRLSARDRLATFVVGGGFLAAALPFALVAGSERSPSPVIVLLLVAGYALLSRVEFEYGPGFGIPTQLALVPMLFLLPVAYVPLLVAAAMMLANAPEYLSGRRQLERAAMRLVHSWHALGPALVLAAFGEAEPQWGHAPVYALAFAAQLVFDFGSAAARGWLAKGVAPWSKLPFVVSAYAVDASLSPVGFLVALAAVGEPYAFLLVLPLGGLIAVFARERRARVDHALELSHAYRGTAFLLGDVVEADDAYTGSHSRDVVELVLAVADELGLDPPGRRDAEFAALLHDVGKIRIPNEIINKAGPLDPDERALMETHTVEGERLLERVGGLLGRVGTIVRSCHERWDGRGYPDGLAGEQIPLVARIVAACDAFNAMTTDRSYRRALPLETALAELEANAGTQFDPAVVAALVAVARRQ